MVQSAAEWLPWSLEILQTDMHAQQFQSQAFHAY
jgi:hypothetical protein